MKIWILVVISVVVSGCTSIKTNVKDDYSIRSELKRSQTRCDYVARMYSGVAFNYCMLNSRDSSNGSMNDVVFLLEDMLLSGVIDTVLIPYTSAKQGVKGGIYLDNIQNKRR